MLNHGLLPPLPHGLHLRCWTLEINFTHGCYQHSFSYYGKGKHLLPFFFYYYENQAHFYLPAPTLYSLPLLSTLSVVRVKLSPACLPFTSKLLERLIHIFRTHFLNISQFLHTWQSRFCPLLDWSGSSEIHPDPVIHHILWPSSSCLSLQYVPLHFCWQQALASAPAGHMVLTRSSERRSLSDPFLGFLL